MDGPRAPSENEWNDLLKFLNEKLRAEHQWSIASEYPTALSTANAHNVRIIKENNEVVSHAVVKPLIIKSPHVVFKVGAIGSVITDERYRQKGLSTQILNECVSLAEKQNCDLAILWTNLFDFYRKLGFELAGSEISFVVDRVLAEPAPGLRFSSDPRVSPEALLRLYAQHSVNSTRTLEETRKFMAIPQTQIHTAWDEKNQLVAYAIEGKGADLVGYIHEWGGQTTHLLSLLSSVWKNKGQNKTLIVPRHSQNLLQKLRSKNLQSNDGFLGMIKILQFDQLASKIKRAFRAEGVSDFVLEKRNGLYWFGVGTEILTVSSDHDMIRLLFGPIDYESLDLLSPQALEKIKKILPLSFWIWGWDSI